MKLIPCVRCNKNYWKKKRSDFYCDNCAEKITKIKELKLYKTKY